MSCWSLVPDSPRGLRASTNSALRQCGPPTARLARRLEQRERRTRLPPTPHRPAPPAAGATLLFVSVGLAAAPKFWTLTRPPPRQAAGGWELASKLGQFGLKKDAPQAKSFSAVAFGGASFPAKSGAPHGIVFLGGALGRVFLFDVPLVGGRDGAADLPAADVPVTSRLTLPAAHSSPRLPRQAQPTLRVTSLMWMLTRGR